MDDAESREKDGRAPGQARFARAIARSVVERVRQGDRDALGIFFEHYFDRVFGLAYRLLGTRAAAEDATQEVFLKVQRAAGRIDPERDPGPWLATITLNTCRSTWRSSAHRMSRRSVEIDPSPDRSPEAADHGRNPEEAYAAGLRERRVQEAILELPETLREVILLRDYEGLDHKEIAEILEVGHDAVRKRYSRALAELGRLLRGRPA